MTMKHNRKLPDRRLTSTDAPLRARRTTTVGSLLSSKRHALGLTLREVSARCDFSLSHLCDMEKGLRLPTVERAQQLAEALGEPAEWLLVPLLQSWLDEAGAGEFVVSVASIGEP